MAKVEAKEEHLIPVSDTGTKWRQTCEILVIHSELIIYSQKFTYLEFVPLGIKAGGWPNEPMETVQQRIRTQMIHRLEDICDALQKPNPPLNAGLILQELSKHFTPCKD